MTNDENAEALGLQALTWTLGEPDRAMRFLSVTGLAPDDLRTRASDPTVLAACLGFLEGHEPDLVTCAEALQVAPTTLVAAHARLEP